MLLWECFLSLALGQVMKVAKDGDEGPQIKASCVQPTVPYQVTGFSNVPIFPLSLIILGLS